MKIWIDLDNTPHVPFFMPIARELESRGHQVVLSARDAFQVCELADAKGVSYTKVGRHYGKNPLMKVFGFLWRSAQLLPFCFRQRPDLAISHGARSQLLLSNVLQIPTILITDYEHGHTFRFARPKWVIIPASLFADDIPANTNRIRYYRGIKEDVYVPEFKPDPSLLGDLDIRSHETVVTVRPPADEAHYHNPESDVLLAELMSRVCKSPGIRAVLLPRNRLQEQKLREAHPDWFANEKTIVPPGALDGLNLLWFSDFVVSGGGTMNREAAALGVPVYSIFRGKTGAVDRRLEKEGRLTMVRTVEEVWTKIQFVRRAENRQPNNRPRLALFDIVSHIEDIIRIEDAGSQKQRKGNLP